MTSVSKSNILKQYKDLFELYLFEYIVKKTNTVK